VLGSERPLPSFVGPSRVRWPIRLGGLVSWVVVLGCLGGKSGKGQTSCLRLCLCLARDFLFADSRQPQGWLSRSIGAARLARVRGDHLQPQTGAAATAPNGEDERLCNGCLRTPRRYCMRMPDGSTVTYITVYLQDLPYRTECSHSIPSHHPIDFPSQLDDRIGLWLRATTREIPLFPLFPSLHHSGHGAAWPRFPLPRRLHFHLHCFPALPAFPACDHIIIAIIVGLSVVAD
jgi:hypothetical protein